MSGHQPSQPADWEPLSQHTEALIRLLNIVEEESEFRLVVAIFSDAAYRNQMIARLDKLVPESACLDIETENDFFEVLNKFYLVPPNTVLVHLIGATAWLQAPLRATDLLHSLNYQREQFAANNPFVTVLWLYDAQVRDFAQNAPDMWAWRAAVLDFAFLPAPDAIISHREIVLEQADSQERRQRLADIEAYLNEQPERYASDAALFREMARIYTLLGDIPQAEEAAGSACDLSREHDDKKGGALALSLLADIFIIRGDLDEALRIRTEEELPVYERLGEIRSIAVTLNALFDLYWEAQEFQKAFEAISRAFMIVEQLGIPDGVSIVGFKFGQALIIANRLDEAKSVLMQSRDAAAKLGQFNQVRTIETLLAEQNKVASDT